MKKWTLLALLCWPLLTTAGVNLKNGNFYISYTDIIVPGGGNKLELSRTYNSKSAENGWFGVGWGTEFETYLVAAPDGSIVVHENGSGAETRFTSQKGTNAEAAVDQIIKEMQKVNPIKGKDLAELKGKLKNNAERRRLFAKKYNVRSKIKKGTVFTSIERGLQKIVKTADGYKRNFNDGKKEFFNMEGKLVKTRDKNGYEVKLNYKSGSLASVKDSQAKQLFFDWYADGKLKSVWSSGDKKTLYKYRGKNLIESKDVADNKYTYKYDSNHNMNEIGYGDGTKMAIKYTPKTQFVSEIINRNKDSTKYQYGANPKRPDLHYWTLVTKKGITGKAVTNRYEYEIKVRGDGSQYTYRILTKINGISTETIYNEKSGLPTKIVRGEHTTTFAYNDKGLLTNKKSTTGEFVKLKYHPKFNKIIRVDNNDGWTTFEYDKRGNLYKAENSKKKTVLLIYDRKGRITKMVDDDKGTKKPRRTLSFTYNAMGKPIKITMGGVGSILVAYDNYGEIKKVESDKGNQMAIQVTQAFQNLLAIVKPAGVNLSL